MTRLPPFIAITFASVITLVALVATAANDMVPTKAAESTATEIATFAGGCFWCTESDFEKVPGVTEVFSGYSGGHAKHPTYRQVSGGNTGHLEVVQVKYDPNKISYEGLLEAFWRMFDPTDAGGSFVDRGHQYSSAIFYHSEEQKNIATKSLAKLQASGRYQKKIATPIRPAETFFKAEEYHQDYYDKNPVRYGFYRFNSGRDQYLEKTWGDAIKVDYTPYQPGAKKMSYTRPSEDEIRKLLTPLQYEVTQEDGTERPFKNEYWDEKRDGIYVDIVSGEPLFSSTDKFKSGTGWPSFTKPLESEFVVSKTDYKLLYPRTEVRSKAGDSHLGHVFKDGPEPTGLRYCINSASLKFIPKDELEKAGYDQYISLFK